MFSKKEWTILIVLVVLVLAIYGGLLLVVTRGGGVKVGSAAPRPAPGWKGLTAQEAYPLAREVARTWQPDAQLSMASSSWRGRATSQELLEGRTTWGFHFVSPAAGQFCVISVVGDKAQVVESGSLPRVPVLLEVADWNVDSPQALSIFLDHGGRDFLTAHAHANADVHLRLLTGVENETLLWLAVGLAANEDPVQTVSIDAVTGAVVEMMR